MPNLSVATQIKIVVATTINKYEQPDPARVLGISTSLWSGQVDFAMAKEHGARFAFIKFFDGKTIDRYAEINYRGAVDAHLLVSGYSWLYNAIRVSPGGAARTLLDFLKDHPCHIRPIVDFEWSYPNPTPSDLYSFALPFCDGYGKLPMDYSAPGYTNQYPPDKNIIGPLWQAQYNKGFSSPMPPWLRWDFLQWTQTGDGAFFGYPPDGEKACELNYWRGTPDELLDFCDVKPSWATPEPIPAPVPPIVVNPPPPTPTPANDVVLDEWWGKAHYQKFATFNSHAMTYHVVTMQITDLADIVFDSRLTMMETGSWLQMKGVDIAINGLDGFYSVRKGRNVFTYLAGFAAYHGAAWGQAGKEQTLFIDENFGISLDLPHRMWSACGFPNLLINNGIMQPLKADDSVRARTAFGVSRDGKTLTILVVDGGDYFVKIGASFLDVANILLNQNVWLGVMGDGGGSTTLCRMGPDGKAVVVNKPSGENADGERSVAVHMGFKLKGSLRAAQGV